LASSEVTVFNQVIKISHIVSETHQPINPIDCNKEVVGDCFHITSAVLASLIHSQTSQNLSTVLPSNHFSIPHSSQSLQVLILLISAQKLRIQDFISPHNCFICSIVDIGLLSSTFICCILVSSLGASSLI
jgi:hypothetical protein